MIPSSREVGLLLVFVLALSLLALVTGRILIVALAPLVVVASYLTSEVLHRRRPRGGG